MPKSSAHRPIRVPVKLVDGDWEFFYGGKVPATDGTIGELIVDKGALTDENFLKALERRSEHKILEEGTALMVGLTVDGRTHPLSKEAKSALLTIPEEELSSEYHEGAHTTATHFVQVTIGPASDRFLLHRDVNVGGLWLQIDRTRPKGVTVSSVVLPKVLSIPPLDSLNHAFTKLSEVYEPWRKSHTGNIYKQVLYREGNGRWYPLHRLRLAAEATEEHALIQERWADFLRQSSLSLVG